MIGDVVRSAAEREWDGGRPSFDRPGWHTAAACRGVGPELFYGAQGERPPARERREAQAREMCAGCPVRDDCRSAGSLELFGVWAGATEMDRYTAGSAAGFDQAIARRAARAGLDPAPTPPRRGGVSGPRIAPRHGDGSFYNTCKRWAPNGKACDLCRDARARARRAADMARGVSNHHKRPDG